MTSLMDQPYWLLVVWSCCILQYTYQIEGVGSDAYDVNDFPDNSTTMPEDNMGRVKRLMITDKAKHWPKAIIPYKFVRVDEKNGKDIMGAFGFYEYWSPIRFYTWNETLAKTIGHPGFIKFATTYGRGWSLLGFYNIKRGQWIDCPHLKTCIHEIGHALGFEHEQYHPEREKWIRVNRPKLYELDTWNKKGWGTFKHYNFDLSSTMLYGPTKRELYSILFPDLKFETRYFYFLKEFCDIYECDQHPQCKNHQLACVNEGYVSVVQDKCACICPRGLDPDTMCRDVLKKGPSKWPMGTYSLLSHKDGCPQGSFSTGLWRHFGTGGNKKQFDSFKGDFSDRKAELSFCTKATESADRKGTYWPPGAYCFFQRGATCPQQKGIYGGKITIPGRTDTSQNVNSGALPSGTYNKDTTLEFCCVQGGFPELPMNLPSEKPFILFPMDKQECQQVAGMQVKMEKLGLWGAKMVGSIRYSKEGSVMHIHYCVYTPLKRDCGAVIEMGPNKRTVTIESDRNNPSFAECYWMFNSPNQKDSLVLSFDELSLTASEKECDNNVEVQPTMIAQKGIVFCGQEKDKSVQSLFGRMRVQFINGNSRSYFKATVKWIPEKEMCYNPEDNGRSYRGTVNYTRKFEPCLPWNEATSCVHKPLFIGDYRDGLEENYCRNPDDSFRPWCYTKLDGCKRNFCDVCHLETPYDHLDDCAARKRNGQCTASDVDCAQSCGLVKPVKKGSDVYCNPPGTVSGGDVEGPTKQRYNLGDKVTFKCRKTGNTIERTCLSTGEWTVANTACLPCPAGYNHYRNNCYKFHFKFMAHVDAVKECKKNGDVLALPQSEGENGFLGIIKFRFNKLWIDAKIDEHDVYRSSDGNPVKVFLWKYHDVPNIDKCVYMSVDGLWRTSRSCNWKFNFACQRPVTDDKPDCKDFLDNCPSLVSSVNSSICDNVFGLDTYCRYSCGLCPRDCDQVINLSQASPKYTITADRRQDSHRFCTWTLKAPNKNGQFVLHFDEFQVKAAGDECVDSVEVRQMEYGAPYIRYCDTNYTKSILMTNDEMLVRFRTPGASSSHFKATVKWISDSAMCYNVSDKGWSYDGRVNFTETFQSCLPWSQALNCGNNTLWNGYFLDNLENNFCRNHDNSERPWCYTEECEKQYCDVCHLVLTSDKSSDCQKFKNDGKCATDLSWAATECAETCKATLRGTEIKVSDVTCSKPRTISEGILPTSLKNSYRVGEKVTYKCQKSQGFTKRTCMASGTWSPVNTACLACPFGFIPFKDKCYKYYESYQDKAGAQSICQKDGAVIATPKDFELNEFVSSLRREERIWLGATKGTIMFMWNDGTNVTWTNWQKTRKLFRYRDDCMVLEKDGKRTDDWCKNKLFHFVCQTDRQPDTAECVDYLDICPSLLQTLPESNCFPYPSLQLYCRASCGMCSKGCGAKVQLSSNSVHSIVANANSGHKFCVWNFEGDDMNGRYIVTINEFTVNQQDSLIMRKNRFGNVTQEYTGWTYQLVTYIYNDKLSITFKTSPNSDSNFKASVKWIKDSDICYNVNDKGWSYNGNMNYAKDFSPCLPWDKSLNCPHNPVKRGDFFDNLDGNYCRNPDQSDQPWCYVKSCQKQNCDVCHLENPVDSHSDCGQRKTNGVCSTKNSIGCAKTCQIYDPLNYVKVSDTQCGPPGQISGGTIQGVTKSQYDVGEKVVYTCTKSSFPIERVCLSSGDWSVANTACLECPMNFVHFKGMCYRFVDKAVNYTNAIEECNKLDSWVATPKTGEENSFVFSLGYTVFVRDFRDILWLGAHKNETEENFFWVDGTPFTSFAWTNIPIREPFKKRDNCIVMRYNSNWNDDWCHDKYFNFVCQRKAYDQPECMDFLDNCPYLLSLTGKSKCGSNSQLETVCRKTCNLCSQGCDHDIQLSQSNPSYVITSDRRAQSQTNCLWKFKGDSNHGLFTLRFEDFDVESTGTKECVSVVEVSQTKHETPQRFCNGKSKPFLEMFNNEMIVRFITPVSSTSHFKARVQWIDDSAMCYNVQDKGRSYNGKVNYTESFQPCLPWSQALDCPHHPLKEEDFLDNLDENYCRNPDGSDQPWCYVIQCKKQYCDVCHLEKPVDISKDCASFKASGYCDTKPKKALSACAATCKAVSTDPLPKVNDISCGPPGRMPGAVMKGQQKQRYNVGDTVTYKCSKGNSAVERTCLTSGDWSIAKTACLECQIGWDLHEDKCYHYVNQFIEYADAVYECKQNGAKVATYKSSAMSSFLPHYCPQDDFMWLGMRKSLITKKYQWSDGDPVTWVPEWYYGQKDVKTRDDCVTMNNEGRIRDDWCNNKYFSFVCEKDSNDKYDCIDFVDKCPQLFDMKRNNKCNSVLNKFCRKTCGRCTLGG